MAMSIEAIRKSSAEQFAMAKADASSVSETTPGSIDADVVRFAATLSGVPPSFVPVVEDKHGLYGWCSDGVREKIAADGGCFAFGWTIWEWPTVLLTAEFHGVWRDEEGNLFDITPKPGGETRIVFVHDPSYQQDFNFDARPRNHRLNLRAGRDRSAELAAIKARLKPGQLQYEERRATKAGRSLDAWLESKLPEDSLAVAIDEWVSACDEFDEHWDSLGVAGNVAVDEKFRVLGLRRYKAQERMRSLLNAVISDAL